jgi:hypothetical protein
LTRRTISKPQWPARSSRKSARAAKKAGQGGEGKSDAELSQSILADHAARPAASMSRRSNFANRDKRRLAG